MIPCVMSWQVGGDGGLEAVPDYHLELMEGQVNPKHVVYEHFKAFKARRG